MNFSLFSCFIAIFFLQPKQIKRRNQPRADALHLNVRGGGKGGEEEGWGDANDMLMSGTDFFAVEVPVECGGWLGALRRAVDVDLLTRSIKRVLSAQCRTCFRRNCSPINYSYH